MPTDPARQPPSHTPTGRRLLRCGRADEATHADLIRHTRDGWPKCCGQTMASFTEAERPRMSDPTPPEGAAPPPAS